MAEKIRHLTYDCSGGGACCTQVRVSLKGDVIEEVEFVDGCDGNHKGIQSLVKGRNAREVIQLLLGTLCDDRGTSCPDQLAKALQAALREQTPISP